MTIPHDPLNRWWVEVSAANPAEVDRLRPTLLAFLAFAPGRQAIYAGTGFVIAGNPEMACVLTAKHVLVEGVSRHQRPAASHAASALFRPDGADRPSIDPHRLKTLWMGQKHAGLLNVVHVNYNDSLDISCCLIWPQEKFADPFEPVSIPIDTAVPKLGDVVHMVSLDMDNRKIIELVSPTDASGVGHTLSLERRVAIRVGVVTGVHPAGLRQYQWPCFTTSIPAEPGMSGGFVVLPSSGTTMGACGIVCADNSPHEARSDQLKCGESIIACTWPALCLRIPEATSADAPTQTLYACMRAGRVTMAVNGIDHIELREDAAGNCAIGMR